MSIETRLRRAARLIRPTYRPPEGWLTEEQWLDVCEERGRAGDFRGEPDFPLALAGFHSATGRAGASGEPPFDPPEGFEPELDCAPHLRLFGWRNPSASLRSPPPRPGSGRSPGASTPACRR